MARKIPYDEACVKAEAITRQRSIIELERDGNLKFFEAAAMENNGPKADELRRKLHETLDMQLDCIMEFQGLLRVVQARYD